MPKHKKAKKDPIIGTWAADWGKITLSPTYAGGNYTTATNYTVKYSNHAYSNKIYYYDDVKKYTPSYNLYTPVDKKEYFASYTTHDNITFKVPAEELKAVIEKVKDE